MEQNKENTSSVSCIIIILKEYFIITVAVLIMDNGICF